MEFSKACNKLNHLDVCLDCTKRNAFTDALHIVECIRYRINQVLYRPSSVPVSQASVYYFVTIVTESTLKSQDMRKKGGIINA